MLLGVDVGGTFTDAVLVDGGRLITAKAPTTPQDQSRGVLEAVRAALQLAGDRRAEDVEAFSHGRTVSTNALLMLASAAETARRHDFAFEITAASPAMLGAIARLGFGGHFAAILKG